MPLKITGRYPVVNHKRTGLFSLDLAMAQGPLLGYPMRTATELYGYPEVGKSTLAYYLASVLAEKKVVICDLEFLDTEYIRKIMTNMKFEGEVQIVDRTDAKGKPIPHEKMLQSMIATLYEEGTGVAIWDSLAAVTAIGEAEGDLGEANWGKRAKLNNQTARGLAAVLLNKTDESAVIGINHVQGIMGGKGHTTPGGNQFKYIAANRIMMYTEKTWTVSDDDKTPIGFQVSGKLEKLRFGGKGRTFGFYIVPSYGVHTGVSAMFDCFEYGLAEQGTTVKVDGKSLGYIRKDLLMYAMEGRMRKFTPFLEKIGEYEKKLEKELKVEPKND